SVQLNSVSVSLCLSLDSREKREMPNWALWSSDFTGWLQELTAQAGYDRIQDLARTYWAHFPIASYLGYDSPDEDTEESKGVPE
uniref:Uncharacterized protein n=1 Tax=Oncorhynchus tshawytscha TaxID=74940 RepID=A0A8C8ESY7_ONCTS